ncbi:MAG: LysR substrate-binding domain-containing protein [Gemmatimonadales bacterium]
MTLRELRYVVAVAEHGHFGRAARACHVSQPTLSTQLKKLEDYLGVTIFERSNKALQITTAGAEIVARARQVVADADALLEAARREKEPLTGPLHVGIIPTLSPYLLPRLIPALTRAYPQSQLIVHEDLTDHLRERLKACRLDAALLALPVDDRELTAEPLFDEPFFFAAPPNHPLARSARVSESELKRQRMLLLADGHCLRDQALAVCGLSEGAGRTDEDMDFRATSLETIRAMVAAGMGCTLLPALAALDAAAEDIEIRPLRTRTSRRIGLVRRRTSPRTGDLELFGAVIRACLPPPVTAV